MTENKAEICAKLGELLKLTRAGADIERIDYDEENDCAAIYYKDKHGYGLLPQFGLRCLNTSGDSGAQLIVDVVNEIMRQENNYGIYKRSAPLYHWST